MIDCYCLLCVVCKCLLVGFVCCLLLDDMCCLLICVCRLRGSLCVSFVVCTRVCVYVVACCLWLEVRRLSIVGG